MKKVYLLLILSIMAVCSVNAQEKGKIRGGMDFGYCMPKGGGGLAVDFNLGYNIADNMNVGVRYASALMAKTIQGNNGMDMNADLKATASYLGTFNYYFNSGSSSFAPFVGCGLGYYGLGNIALAGSNSSAGVDGKFGGLLTTGFELGKFRLGAEYNIVPSSKLLNNSTVKNSYFVVSLGFYLGGGRWKK